MPRTLLAKSTSPDSFDIPHENQSRYDRKSIFKLSVGMMAILVMVITIGSVTGTLAVLLPMTMLVVAGAGFFARQLQHSNNALSFQLDEVQKQFAVEARASRVLSGIKIFRTRDGLSQVAKLAKAARLATGYQASVVFELRDSQGVLIPSNWNYEGSLDHIRDAFESVDSDLPGAMAARQGSAIVISSAETGGIALPSWAEQAGFVHGIVAPISSGLNTKAVVYVLKNSGGVPTLQDIEQLELVLNFTSSGAVEVAPVISEVSRKAFREDVTLTRADETSEPARPIRMPGFALNTESERMEMDGVSLSLSPTEFSLIHALASSPNQPVSSESLMDSCWGSGSRPADNAVDVAIFRLRKKLSRLESGKGVIKTVRGSGYMFIPPRSEVEDRVTAD